MAETTKLWTPNPKQKAFLKALENADGGLTLFEASKIIGEPIVSGAVNVLKTKGLVETSKVTYECDLVRKDTHEVVGSTKKEATIYKLKVAQ